MSSPLAIAAVTAVLKDLLNNGLINHDLSTVGSFTVSALPPDRITTGTQEPNQLNLFLYQVTPNQGWRNASLPSRASNGERWTNPPLALDLHYLLTAYGAQDFNAEILLGYAMQLLHETPGLSRQDIRTALGAPSPIDPGLVTSPFGNLSAIDLAEQVEQIKITPQYLTTEELSKLWTAMQARYRPTMAYQVSVVLIQSTRSTKAPLPVLQRGKDDRGIATVPAPAPSLTGVTPADSQPAVRLGETLTILGQSLGSEGIRVRFRSLQLSDPSAATPAPPIDIAPAPGGTADQLTVQLRDAPEDPTALDRWAPGFYSVALAVQRPNLPAWTTNEMAIALAPVITVTPATAPPGTLVTVTCRPRLRARQRVSLLFGEREIPVKTVSTPADTASPTVLTFTVPHPPQGTVGVHSYIVRLRVDGVESIPVVRHGTRLEFDPQQKVTIA
jgi:hypothetical protein